MPPRVNGKKKVEAKPNVVVDGDANDSNEVDSGTPILLDNYWKRTALNGKECVVRVLRVPISAGVRYYVRILSKHVAARSYEDLRRDPTNPLLIHESPSWRAVSV